MADSFVAGVIAVAALGIWWSLPEAGVTRTTTVRMVYCSAAKNAKGDEVCASADLVHYEVVANMALSEVSVFRNGRAINAYKFKDCSILDAENWLCRQSINFSGKPVDENVSLIDGRFNGLYRGGMLKSCYPNRLTYWLLDAGPKGLVQSFSASTLNCF
jgi:hypothetical protein